MTKIGELRGAACVTRAGRVVLQTAGGAAAAGGARCTTDSVFQVASVSKQFAAAATLLLVEDGALALSHPVRKWLPQWPDGWSGITLHDLLTHTGGVGHWEDVLPGGMEDLPPLSEVLGAIADAPLLERPPCPFRYSSPGYVVLAAVLQQSGGMPYGQLIRERIFRPLGMTSTSTGARPTESVAEGRDGGTPANVVHDLAAMPGAGDAWSTVGDLVRYTEALREGRLLRPSSLRTMYTPHALVDDGDEATVYTRGYGYGTLLGAVAGHPARFHTGDNPGYLSFHGWLPDLDMTVVVLSNDGSSDTDALAAALVRAALGS